VNNEQDLTTDTSITFGDLKTAMKDIVLHDVFGSWFIPNNKDKL